MPRYDELDFIDDLLLEEEIIVRDSVRSFVNSMAMPKMKESFARSGFPVELVREMASEGILGGNLELDGLVEDFFKISEVSYGLVMQELERADSGLRSFASVQGALVMYPILQYGSLEQKQKWLPDLYSGRAIGCFGLTEEQGGSDPMTMLSNVQQRDGGYILRGKKAWITNGEIADVAVVWARDEKNKIKGLLVPKDVVGFSSSPMVAGDYKNSMRASVTSYLIFDDCFLTEDNVLPLADGAKAYLNCLSKARYGIAWGVIGAAYSCLREVVEYCGERVLFGAPLSQKQLVQQELAIMKKDIMMAQAAMLSFGRLADAGKLTHTDISLCKMNNVTSCLNIARRADELLGANRISWEYDTPRHLANLRSVETYEGTRFIHTLIQGSDITGYKAY
ncbi:MAG: acyl-CoA dehydrogenase family protein [Spirochaetota bacterium]|nr:acyl-CoA dehydrogenase family protein [Spirochaetota bacterium]